MADSIQSGMRQVQMPVACPVELHHSLNGCDDVYGNQGRLDAFSSIMDSKSKSDRMHYIMHLLHMPDRPEHVINHEVYIDRLQSILEHHASSYVQNSHERMMEIDLQVLYQALKSKDDRSGDVEILQVFTDIMDGKSEAEQYELVLHVVDLAYQNSGDADSVLLVHRARQMLKDYSKIHMYRHPSQMLNMSDGMRAVQSPKSDRLDMDPLDELLHQLSIQDDYIYSERAHELLSRALLGKSKVEKEHIMTKVRRYGHERSSYRSKVEIPTELRGDVAVKSHPKQGYVGNNAVLDLINAAVRVMTTLGSLVRKDKEKPVVLPVTEVKANKACQLSPDKSAASSCALDRSKAVSVPLSSDGRNLHL